MHLLVLQVNLDIVEHVHGAHLRAFQYLPQLRQPLLDRLVGRSPLVLPVGGEPFLRDLVHALRANLHLHPAVIRAEHGGLQRLVPVRLGHGNPVPQALWVGRVLVGHDRVSPPAIGLLLRPGTVEDETNGEDVVYLLELHLLLTHLVQDRGDRLRPPLHLEFDPPVRELLHDRGDKLVDVFLPSLP